MQHRLLKRVRCGKLGTHIHHPSLVKRLGFLYYVIGDVYDNFRNNELHTDFSRCVVHEYTVKSNVRVIETTTFDKLDGKKFELRDAFSNNKYKFKLVKRKGEWMVIYPIRKWRMSKK